MDDASRTPGGAAMGSPQCLLTVMATQHFHIFPNKHCPINCFEQPCPLFPYSTPSVFFKKPSTLHYINPVQRPLKRLRTAVLESHGDGEFSRTTPGVSNSLS